jgi:RNA polymerase sigma-70 factor, ECF subfamily
VQTPTTEPNPAEFTMFMRAYQDMVFSTAARLTGNDAQAEDIAQEVFLRAYEHFSELRGNPAAGGWLKTVGINLTLNHLTRHRRRWRLFSELDGARTGDEAAAEIDWEVPDTLLAELGAEERRRFVEAALQRLPEHQRLVLVLYHFEELSYQDIAEKLQVSLPKVKTDMRRARAALLTIFRRSGTVADPLSE